MYPKFERIVQYFRDDFFIIVKYLPYLRIRYDIPESLDLLTSVGKARLKKLTSEGDVVVPYRSRQKFILGIDDKFWLFALGFNHQFLSPPKSAGFKCRVNDLKVCQKYIILLPELLLLHGHHQIFRFVLLELLVFFLEEAEIEGDPQIGQIECF